MAETNLRVLRPNSTRSFTDFVGNGDLADTYLFTINAPTNFNLLLTDMAQDANVQLFRDVNRNGIIDQADGAAIASSSRLGSADDFINTQLTRSGNYIARVQRVGNSNVNYTLRLSNQGTGPSNLLPTEIDIRRLTATPFSRRELLSVADTADVYRFTMRQVGNFNASLTGMQTGTNLNMRLIRDLNDNGVVDAGEQIVRATSAANRNESLNVSSLGIGNYILQTYLVSGRRSNYTLKLSNTGTDPSNLLAHEGNARVLAATPFILTNSLGTNDAADVYLFTMGDAGNFNATLTGFPNGSNFNMQLIKDANGNGVVDAGDVVVSTMLDSSSDDAINVRSLAAGRYFLQTYRVTGSGNYTLRMSNTGDLQGNLLAVESDNVPLDEAEINGSLSTNNASNTYRFALANVSDFNATATGIEAENDINIRLIRDANTNGIVDPGEEIVQTNNSGNAEDAINFKSLAAGSYILQTYLSAGTGSDYTLQISSSLNNLVSKEIDAGSLLGDPLRPPFNQTNSLSLANATDTYRFEMASSGHFNASLTGIPTDNNFDMRLIRDANNNGVVDTGDVLVSAQAANNSDDAINVRSLALGEYFLQVYRFVGDGGNYNLKMSNTGLDSTEPSNLLPTEVDVGTVNITAPVTRTGSLSANNASDIFRFNVTASSTVTLTLSGLSVDADLRLIRDNNNDGIVSEGDEIARSNNLGTSNETVGPTTPALAAGNYFAQVFLVPDEGAMNTSYTLGISAVPTP